MESDAEALAALARGALLKLMTFPLKNPSKQTLMW